MLSRNESGHRPLPHHEMRRHNRTRWSYNLLYCGLHIVQVILPDESRARNRRAESTSKQHRALHLSAYTILQTSRSASIAARNTGPIHMTTNVFDPGNNIARGCGADPFDSIVVDILLMFRTCPTPSLAILHDRTRPFRHLGVTEEAARRQDSQPNDGIANAYAMSITVLNRMFYS